MYFRKKLVIIDSNGILYRYYYALPPMYSNNIEIPIQGLYGLIKSIFNILRVYKEAIVVVTFDRSIRNYKKKISEQYKSNRTADIGVISNIDLALDFFERSKFWCDYNEEYEADDLIGTYIEEYQDKMDITVVGNDKDLFSLVNDGNRTRILDIFKKKYYNESAVKAQTGVHPKDIARYLALKGDAVDNIKGLKGIGTKRAIDIIEGRRELSKEEEIELEFNLRLTNLNKESPIRYKELEGNKIDYEILERLLEFYDFNSMYYLLDLIRKDKE